MTTTATPQDAPRTVSTGAFLARYGLLIALVMLATVFTALSQAVSGQQFFLTERNLLQIALQASINAVIAVGMTFVITSGGIDLSVGSIVALVGIVIAAALKGWGVSPYGALLIGVAVGVLCGSINGLLITRANLPPFIATLGTMGIFRGLALIFSEGRPQYGLGEEFVQAFAGQVGPIPIPVIIAAIVAVIFAFVLVRTKIGEYTIAIGGNEETARLSGINVKTYKVIVYAMCGGLAGLGGVILTARIRAAEPIAGASFELDAIAATVMGGTSLIGGEGTVWGTIIGALFISLVRNGMNVLNVQAYWQQLVIGAVIILAVVIDRLRKR